MNLLAQYLESTNLSKERITALKDYADQLINESNETDDS